MTLPKPYYHDERAGITIYHGDCREVLKKISGVSLLLADPPYFRVVDEDWDDQWGADVNAFLGWIGIFLDIARATLIDRGTIAVFCSPDLSCGVESEIRRRFAFLNHIVWRKPGPGRLGRMDKSSMRRFFPTSERLILAEQCRNPDGDMFRFRDHVNHSVARDVYSEIRERLVSLRDAAGLSNQEVDVALGKNGMSGHYFGASQWSLPTEEAWKTISEMMAIRGVVAPPYETLRQEFDSRRQEFDSRRREFDSSSSRIELLSDVWTFQPPAGNNRWGHPTQKPESLIGHIVETCSRDEDVILDPFMGSGTTLRVAKELGRKAIGIEIEEKYCEIAAKRLAQEVLPGV